MAEQAQNQDSMAAVTLDWTGLDALGFLNDDVRIFDRAQTAFFQPLFSYAQPDAAALKRVLHPIGSSSRALRLIVHGVFPRTSKSSDFHSPHGTTHLMTPLIHSLELLFAEKNSIRASQRLEVCMLILSVYKMLADEHPDDNVDCNDCVCQAVEFHQENHNLNPSIDHSEIQQHCYGKHITPLQILLKNVKQRKCPSLDISNLIETMFSLVCGEERSLSTLYITINESTRKSASAMDDWACPQCTLINAHDNSRCNACFGPKPREAFSFLTEEERPRSAAKFRAQLMSECKSDSVEIGVALYNLKVNIHRLSIGHVALMLEHGCAPLSIRIKDDLTHTICDISKEQLVRHFDAKFSALQLVKDAAADSFDDIYPLMVLHSEARAKLRRILSVCELSGRSTVLRHYFELIGDFVYGETFPKDDVYDTKLRMGYCRQQLNDLGVNESRRMRVARGDQVKNGEFFRYWLGKYCLTDRKFLNKDPFMKKDLKMLCEQTPALRSMLYQFKSVDAEMYNSYYY